MYEIFYLLENLLYSNFNKIILINDKIQKFMVYEDTANATATKIHKISCFHFKQHLRTGSITTKWHGSYDLHKAIKTAEKISSKYTTGWRKAGCCFIE